MSIESGRVPRLPPRWFVRSAWVIHRALYRITGGRFGLRKATTERWGMLRLRTVGRLTGKDRWTILGYIEDAPNLVLLAMNGWADGTPDWWLNLMANPDAGVDLVDGSRTVTARPAVGDERSRLWARWADYDDHLDSYAGRRSQETPVVILEPRTQL